MPDLFGIFGEFGVVGDIVNDGAVGVAEERGENENESFNAALYPVFVGV